MTSLSGNRETKYLGPEETLHAGQFILDTDPAFADRIFIVMIVTNIGDRSVNGFRPSPIDFIDSEEK